MTRKAEPEQPPEQRPRRIVPKYLNDQDEPFWPHRVRLPFPVKDQEGNVIEPGTLVVVSNGKVQVL